MATVPYSRSLQQEAANKAEIHRQNAERIIEGVCFSPRADPNCVQQARNAQQESQRQEYDLAAQKMSAWWAQVMGVAALIGMGLSALGVWLVYTTFRETKENNRISMLAVKNAEEAAFMARADMIDAERAFIRVTEISQRPFNADKPKLISIAIKIDNTGRQNARDFEIGISVRRDAIYAKPEGRMIKIDQIMPPNYHDHLKEFPVNVRFDGEYYLIGFISYRTVYGARFKSYFCFLSPDRPRLDEASGLIENQFLTDTDCSRIPENT